MGECDLLGVIGTGNSQLEKGPHLPPTPTPAPTPHRTRAIALWPQKSCRGWGGSSRRRALCPSYSTGRRQEEFPLPMAVLQLCSQARHNRSSCGSWGRGRCELLLPPLTHPAATHNCIWHRCATIRHGGGRRGEPSHTQLEAVGPSGKGSHQAQLHG